MNNNNNWHRILVAPRIREDGALVAPFPTYSQLAHAADRKAWISVPPDDCPCRFAGADEHRAALTERYPAADVTACAALDHAASPDHHLDDARPPTPPRRSTADDARA